MSNLYRIGQQAFITRTMYSEKAKAEREQKIAERAKVVGQEGRLAPSPPRAGAKGDADDADESLDQGRHGRPPAAVASSEG